MANVKVLVVCKDLVFWELIVQVFFVCFELTLVGARRVGGPKFRAFFPCPAAKFVLFFPLWGSSRGILVVFEAPGRSNVNVWALRRLEVVVDGLPMFGEMPVGCGYHSGRSPL